MTNDNTITSDGQGILVGVTPASPQTTNTWQPVLRPDQEVSQPQVQIVQPQVPSNLRFSEEDIERARQQEKEKLYPRLEEMSTQLKQLTSEREAEQAERQRLANEAEEARRAKEEGEMEVRDLLAKREASFQTQIEELKARYDTDRAIFERERSLQEAYAYRIARIERNRNTSSRNSGISSRVTPQKPSMHRSRR
jgi:hypothetical protein